MNGLTLKHLRYLDALARHGHFGRAADACAITQPALSLQIKELETMLGAPLVERTTRQIRLTALGEDFVNRARTILLAVDDLADLARSHNEPVVGRLRLGVIPTIAPYLLPDVINALTRQFTKLELELREAVTQSLINALLDARLDLAVVALPISEPALAEYPLFQEDFVLVRPIDEAATPVPSPELLREMRLLLLEEGHCFRDQALSFCEMKDLPPRQLMEGSSLTTLVQMVGAGMGVTLIPEMAVPLETRSALIATARFAPPSPARTVGLVWRKNNPLAEQLKLVGAVIQEAGHLKLAEIERIS